MVVFGSQARTQRGGLDFVNTTARPVKGGGALTPFKVLVGVPPPLRVRAGASIEWTGSAGK